MAEGDEEEKDEKKEKKEKSKSPIMMILIVFVISILLGGGGVFVWFKFSSSPHDGERVTETIMEESSDAMDTVGAMLPLETFIVNLADEEASKYLKITIELEVESEKVLEEIRKSFEFFSNTSGNEVDRVFFSGGGALIPGIDAFFSDQLKIPVETLDPLKGIKIPRKIFDRDSIEHIGSLSTVAIGLATRRFDHT